MGWPGIVRIRNVRFRSLLEMDQLLDGGTLKRDIRSPEYG
jgi:hypothetical protein